MKILPTSIRDIDTEDTSFKISRNRIDDSLRASIRDFGILDPPVLIDGHRGLTVIFGHNRVRIASELGCEEIRCARIEAIDGEWFAGQAILKCRRNELGPAGRLRALKILRDTFRLHDERLRAVAARGFMLPSEYAESDLLDKALALPAPLIEYLDDRDVPFRTISECLRLSESSRGLLSKWVADASLKVNIFRSLVSMIADIEAGGGAPDRLREIAPCEGESRSEWEDRLYETLYAIRYPRYSSAKGRADEIIRIYSEQGIDVEVPRFFEGDSIALRLSIRKGEDPSDARQRLEKADMRGLSELLDLL